MKKHFITLTTGEKFPVEMSLGAMLLFKHETGKEATEADMGSLSDLTILLWGGAAAASEVQGIPFLFTPQQFANRLTSEALSGWAQVLADDAAGSSADASAQGEKKSPSAS